MKGRIDERGVKAYIAFDDGKEADTLPEITPCPRGCKGEVDNHPPKDSARKRFTRATKAVFLEMSLVCFRFLSHSGIGIVTVSMMDDFRVYSKFTNPFVDSPFGILYWEFFVFVAAMVVPPLTF